MVIRCETCGEEFDGDLAINQLIETGYSDWERHLDGHDSDAE